ncbi:hypothetical protein [Anthocerotibacter panamensis]|uniref:hypothetical protein n=1 Tax=Anthocerotibacter panamensis TaxID=2857077 RepID=UPI001FD8EC84|nr:hypothetical protein [Anthocerotibacter panamensis]
MDELSPIFRALSDHPLPFLGGFFSGLFRLSTNEDPVRNWLVEHMAKPSGNLERKTTSENNGQGPQRIDIE